MRFTLSPVFIGRECKSERVGAKGAFSGTISGMVTDGFIVTDAEDGTKWVRNPSELTLSSPVVK